MTDRLTERMDENKKYSVELCELLNKFANNNIKYSPIWSNDSVGVRQILSKDELHYKEMFFIDKIKEEMSLEKVVDMIYTSLGTGRFKYVYPSNLEKELYEEFEKYNWDILIDRESLWIDGDEIYTSDILSKEITQDKIKFELDKLESGYSSVVITKGEKFFDIEYAE